MQRRAKGSVIWFTGLSGSGKSTLAGLMSEELERRGVHAERLDGDEIRKNLSPELGFSPADRDENIRRIGFVAALVERCGACAVVAAISPYRTARDAVRRSVQRFVEIHVDCPIDVLKARDPKGLYKRALAGELTGFTGLDAPYEPPLSPELHVRTDLETPAQTVARILSRLEELGAIPRP